MDEQVKPIAVNPQNAKVVYAIPAKKKPKEPLWKEYFGNFAIAWCCVIGVIYFWLNP